MKTTVILIIATFLAASLLYINDYVVSMNDHPEKYCARMQDGRKVVMHQGAVVMSEVVLKNGTRIKPDGNVTKPDGSTVELKAGECVSMDGSIEIENDDTKPK